MNDPAAFDLELQVAARHPDRRSSAQFTLLEVTLRLANPGDDAVAPGIFASELLVDGRPDPSWRLALNGPVEPELVELPPGGTAELTREVGVRALNPGRHRIQVRLGEQYSAVVEIEVAGATE